MNSGYVYRYIPYIGIVSPYEFDLKWINLWWIRWDNFVWEFLNRRSGVHTTAKFMNYFRGGSQWLHGVQDLIFWDTCILIMSIPKHFFWFPSVFKFLSHTPIPYRISLVPQKCDMNRSQTFRQDFNWRPLEAIQCIRAKA